jgi:hypothetical protein
MQETYTAAALYYVCHSVLCSIKEGSEGVQLLVQSL